MTKTIKTIKLESGNFHKGTITHDLLTQEELNKISKVFDLISDERDFFYSQDKVDENYIWKLTSQEEGEDYEEEIIINITDDIDVIQNKLEKFYFLKN